MLVSVPPTMSVTEEDDPIRVCATLSVGIGVMTNIPISITLATSDGKFLLICALCVALMILYYHQVQQQLLVLTMLWCLMIL